VSIASAARVLERFPVGVEYGVDREVHTTAGQEAGATCSSLALPVLRWRYLFFAGVTCFSAALPVLRWRYLLFSDQQP
jgi:hypothetical protein